jgi:hypothetical protein
MRSFPRYFVGRLDGLFTTLPGIFAFPRLFQPASDSAGINSTVYRVAKKKQDSSRFIECNSLQRILRREQRGHHPLPAKMCHCGNSTKRSAHFPVFQTTSVGPFISLDHFGPVGATQKAMNVGPHPHLSHLFECAILRQDSRGVEQKLCQSERDGFYDFRPRSGAFGTRRESGFATLSGRNDTNYIL